MGAPITRQFLAHKFMEHFSSICTSVNQAHSQTLKSDFLELKRNYVGTPLTDEYRFDVELIAGRGKAAGLLDKAVVSCAIIACN